MIKRVEVNYRGIFQKNLGKKIGSDIVMIASRMGQKAFSNGRYSDSPERNGIPCKYFAFVSPGPRRGGIGSGVRRQARDRRGQHLGGPGRHDVQRRRALGMARHPPHQRKGGRGRLPPRSHQQKTGRAAKVHRQEAVQLPHSDAGWRRQPRRALGHQRRHDARADPGRHRGYRSDGHQH